MLATWREALLAQAVLAGRTRGYRQHPQLLRFMALPDPVAGIGCYLHHVATEAAVRGYRFDTGRIISSDQSLKMAVTDGQLQFEWTHLLRKLGERDPERWRTQRDLSPRPHPMFTVVAGPIESWERQ